MTAPYFLKPNDKVMIIATAKSFDVKVLIEGVDIIKKWKLEVLLAPHLYATHFQYAGTDLERTTDLQLALDHPEVKAIFCARGGYGTGRIVDQLNFEKFKKYPKWICGFSDITVLLTAINRQGFQGLHAAMPPQCSTAAYRKSVLSLKNTLFGKPLAYHIPRSPYNKVGKATAAIVGGNLTILHCQIDTQNDLDWNGNILFIEEIGEQYYHLDRMLVHLKRAGKLSKLKGMVVGHFTNMKDGEIPFGKTIEEIILDAVKEYEYPVLFNFPAGHETANMPVILGRLAQLEVTTDKVELSYL